MPLGIVGGVRDELERHKSHGAAFKKWLPSSGLTVIEIVLGSALLGLLQQLITRADLKDHGEHATVAVAAMAPGMVFVANDRNAVWLAIHELHLPGERVIGLQVFLRRAREVGDLDKTTIDDVFKASNPKLRATWWGPWWASLT
jgi:hypothetical protein